MQARLGLPHLKVEVDPALHEDYAVTSAILVLVVGAMALVGVILLVLAFVQNQRAKMPSTPA